MPTVSKKANGTGWTIGARSARSRLSNPAPAHAARTRLSYERCWWMNRTASEFGSERIVASGRAGNHDILEPVPGSEHSFRRIDVLSLNDIRGSIGCIVREGLIAHWILGSQIDLNGIHRQFVGTAVN